MRSSGWSCVLQYISNTVLVTGTKGKANNGAICTGEKRRSLAFEWVEERAVLKAYDAWGRSSGSLTTMTQ